MKYFLVYFILICFKINSQDLSFRSKFNFELYGDFFINGTLHNQPSHKISDILYSYNRTNEFGINMIYFKSNYSNSNFRINIALLSGTYSIDNYADEPQLFQNLLEGNVGFKLAKKTNTWLDIGVFSSHLGYESAIGYDCWNISRSLLSENSPYYETGAKLTHISKNEKLTQSYLLINGWQRITMVEGHSIPAIGVQYIYKPNAKWMLNYSNFIGSIRPDSNVSWRIYQDFFATYQIAKKWTVLFYFDLGIDKNEIEKYAHWFGGNLSFRYFHDKKNSFSVRSEFINDPHDVLYPQFNYSWIMFSNSINWDLRLNQFSLLRTELKYMKSNQNIILPMSNSHLGAFVALQVKI